MPILAGDIKLVASQVMNDVAEGGGAPTATVIADGVSNSIFNDISELDRAGGRVNLRKAFVSVQTANVDGYFGANVIVADAPDDPLVSVTLFSTKDTFDERDAAKARIESYLAQGATWAGYLFGNHIAGQLVVSLLARTTVPPPVVGDTYVLRKLEGTAGEFEQFVRITDVTVTLREFEDDRGIFTRNELVLRISDPLRLDFPGFEAQRFDTSINYTGKTRTCSTIVADAARYYGVVPLVAAAAIGDFTINASGIFTQLVPSAQIETPIADARMNQQSAALVASGAAVTQTLTLAFSTTQAMYVGGGILPGSLTVVRAGITVADSGGKLINAADTSQVGLIDYANGVLTLATNVFGTSGGAHAVTFTPATTPKVISESIGIAVTQAGQRLTYVATISPVPAKASTVVSYRAQGRWYVLTEDGSGALRGGDSSVGVGTLNFSTGTLSLTLGALPDVGSEIIIGYEPIAAVRSIAASAATSMTTALDGRAFMLIDLGAPIKPGSLTITWNDGIARTAGDLRGAITGTAAVGEVIYSKGYIRISPNLLPASGTVFTVAVTASTPQSADITAFTDGGSTWNFALSGTVRAGSVDFGVAVSHAVRQFPGIDTTVTRLLRVFDDGLGILKVVSVSANVSVGTVDYATGACTLIKSLTTFQDVQPTYANFTPFGTPGIDATRVQLSGTEVRTVTLAVLNGTGAALDLPAWAWWTGSFGVAAKARFAGSDGATASTGYTLTSLIVRSNIAMFGLGATRYRINLGNNSVESDVSPTTGIGTASGTWTSGYSQRIVSMS